MVAKLIVEGKEFPIEIQDPELQKLLVPQKKTGYERVECNGDFYYDVGNGTVSNIFDDHRKGVASYYDVANYYSDPTVAENNARADKLMRQLRRFAVERRENKLEWNNGVQRKYYIYYDYAYNEVAIYQDMRCRHFYSIYFDTEEAAKAAITTFKDELIWYFTEYKDSL